MERYNPLHSQEDEPVPMSHPLPPLLASLAFSGYVVTRPGGEWFTYILPPLCDIPAGPFLMGSDPEVDQDAQADELPQHWVEVASFQMATFPVTVAEYSCYVEAGHAAPRTTGAAYLI